MTHVGSGKVSKDLDDLWPAELELLKAIQDSKRCDLIDTNISPSPQTISGWTEQSRTIRAEILKRLLIDGPAGHLATMVAVRGAIIIGDLELADEKLDKELTLTCCKIGLIDATGATFTENASFEGSSFTRKSKFQSTVFSRGAVFSKVTFTQNAMFYRTTFTQHATFGRSKFTAGAQFGGTTFTLSANFAGAEFSNKARFSGAKFIEGAKFSGVMFAANTTFAAVTFTGDARFGGVTFGRDGVFGGSTFTQKAVFQAATFTGKADFGGVTFTESAQFDKALAEDFNFVAAQFHSRELGPLTAKTLSLDASKFHERVRLTALCKEFSAKDAQFVAGGQLQIHAASMALPSVEFLARTIIADPGDTVFNDQFFADRAANTVRRLRLRGLIESLKSLRGTKTSISDLRSANVSELVLSSISLKDCYFTGAHGLDTLRFDSSCDLRSSKDLPKLWRNSKRKIIVEELNFREIPGPGLTVSKPDAAADARTEQVNAAVDALDIATIYRDLRRGLESNKNEPGAADFYYGEMEMRRRSKYTPLAERGLLWLYWAVSGYGLRALRAFIMVGVVIFGTAVVFATVGIVPPSGTEAAERSVDVTSESIGSAQAQPAEPKVPQLQPSTVPNDASILPPELAAEQPPGLHATTTVTRSTGIIADPVTRPQDPPNVGDAIELAARSSVALLRNPADRVELTTIGTFADIVLRLLTPVLLGLALLALRGRTKR
ncbi:pentapeptide repeat-containing protein [Rhodococcus sp. APC 3903]|uniref:pentapeptide repeat-containing protein n=1 Tax=Rhodococcus sp. APC 3903 TaxID=3035193 RepID=UPI0025B32850|nr:pentapeptide repeat-containing protein [Rhodococcus sp. APC 3903]MDN3460808.1 hypothetical protein [Rhodococcus sp. APC 3903]